MRLLLGRLPMPLQGIGLAGFVTRDAREVERKNVGFRSARTRYAPITKSARPSSVCHQIWRFKGIKRCLGPRPRLAQDVEPLIEQHRAERRVVDTWRYQNSEYFEGGRRLIAHPNTGHVVTAAQVMAWLELKGHSPLELAKHFRAWLQAKGVLQEVEVKRLAPKQVPPSHQAEEPPRKRSIMVRRALVDHLGAGWPSIEHDLREASRNELVQAKTVGGWDVEMAVEWAVMKGKLRREAPKSTLFPSKTHRIL